MRKGKEFYSGNYEKVIELYKKGFSVNEISSHLKISYSCVYNWVKSIRKPEKGNLIEFIDFLRDNGPAPVIEIKQKFPKHSEIFLTAQHRDMGVLRFKLPRKFGEYSMWYLLKGQEHKLKQRVRELLNKYEELKQKLLNIKGITYNYE